MENPPTPTQCDENLALVNIEIVEAGSESFPPLATKLLVGVGLFLAVFLVGLDQTIVATALPKISDHFQSLNDVGWYASAFFLTMYIKAKLSDRRTALQPTFGKLYKVFNVKRVFLIALAVFEVGSLICGLAPSSASLILGRAIAGSGAAVLNPQGLLPNQIRELSLVHSPLLATSFHFVSDRSILPVSWEQMPLLQSSVL
jgi:MFS family permease